MSKLTFPQKNDFVVKHTDAQFFDKDLELFKKHCPGHKLNNQLAKASEYNKSKLVGLMLSVLLDKITPAEILANRDKEIIVQPERKTLEQTKDFLLNTIGLDEDDLQAMGDTYIEFLSFKSDDELIDLFAKMLSARMAENKQYPVIAEPEVKTEPITQEVKQDPVIADPEVKAEPIAQEVKQDPVVVDPEVKAVPITQEVKQDPVIAEPEVKAEPIAQDEKQDPVKTEETAKKKDSKVKNSPK